jgi:flagellar biosynthesis protein FlhG
MSTTVEWNKFVGTKPIKVIAIASGKGGIGKSFVAINLAIALSQKNKKVLLLDADLAFPNLDILLGLKSHYNLSHVAQGMCSLQDTLLPGPDGIYLIPGAMCNEYMTHLTPTQYAGIVDSFNTLAGHWDYMIIDTAVGVSEGALGFTRSSQDVIVVTCDEPAALIDTYAFIKLLYKRYQWRRFHVLANMMYGANAGPALFKKLSNIMDRFLDVHLNYMGSIPFDVGVRQAIKKQQSVVCNQPNSEVANVFKHVASIVDEWPHQLTMGANTSFFLERT